MATDPRDLIHRLSTLLDAAMPLLDRAASAEKRDQADKALRAITAQSRAAAARVVIDEARRYFWYLEDKHG